MTESAKPNRAIWILLTIFTLYVTLSLGLLSLMGVTSGAIIKNPLFVLPIVIETIVDAIILPQAHKNHDVTQLSSAYAILWLTAFMIYHTGTETFTIDLSSAVIAALLLHPPLFTLLPMAFITLFGNLAYEMMHKSETTTKISVPKKTVIAAIVIITCLVLVTTYEKYITEQNNIQMRQSFDDRTQEAQMLMREAGLDKRGFVVDDLCYDYESETAKFIFATPQINRTADNRITADYIHGTNDIDGRKIIWQMVSDKDHIYAFLVSPGRTDDVTVVETGADVPQELLSGDSRTVIYETTITPELLDSIEQP